MPIGKYIYCTTQFYYCWFRRNVTNAYRQVHLLYAVAIRSEKQIMSQMPIGKYIYCTPKFRLGFPVRRHKCLSASTFTVPKEQQKHSQQNKSHKCLSASTFTVQVIKVDNKVIYQSQMPIGKYIYCTHFPRSSPPHPGIVTNAYRQVHLLYLSKTLVFQKSKLVSQMPIGKYIYCTRRSTSPPL